MKITICCSGSRGELQPYLAVGQALASRGHSITIATELRMESLVQEFGFGFEKIFGDPTELLWDPDPKVQKALKNGSVLQLIDMMKKLEKKYPKAEVYESYIPATRGADMLIAANLTIFQTAVAAEFYKIPWIAIILGPTLPTSEFPLFFLKSIAFCSCMNKWTYTFVHKQLWKDEKKVIGPFRAKLGLDPWNNYPLGLIDVMNDQRIPIVIAASELLCGPKRKTPIDYPSNAKVAGFFFVKATSQDSEINTELLGFVSESDRPVVYMGFGSMPCPYPEEQLQIAYDVCEQCHVKVVIVAGWSQLVDNVKCQAIMAKAGRDRDRLLLVIQSAPHDWLFPRMRCVVHHCGVGTMAAALRAGVAQIPVPVLLDQPHNASVVLGLGVAPCSIPFSKLNTRKLVDAVKMILKNAAYTAKAKELGEFVCRESAHALDLACDTVEGQCRARAAANGMGEHHYQAAALLGGEKEDQTMLSEPLIAADKQR